MGSKSKKAPETKVETTKVETPETTKVEKRYDEKKAAKEAKRAAEKKAKEEAAAKEAKRAAKEAKRAAKKAAKEAPKAEAPKEEKAKEEKAPKAESNGDGAAMRETYRGLMDRVARHGGEIAKEKLVEKFLAVYPKGLVDLRRFIGKAKAGRIANTPLLTEVDGVLFTGDMIEKCDASLGKK